MVVDTSAILAIIFEEAEFAAVVSAIDSAKVVRISVATYFEAAMVLDRRGDALQRSALDDLMEKSDAHLEPVTFEQAKLARQAFEQYGKGRHPAALNYGDCFTYALAKATREPVLFKGSDSSKTDLPLAVKPPQ